MFLSKYNVLFSKYMPCDYDSISAFGLTKGLLALAPAACSSGFTVAPQYERVEGSSSRLYSKRWSHNQLGNDTHVSMWSADIKIHLPLQYKLVLERNQHPPPDYVRRSLNSRR